MIHFSAKKTILIVQTTTPTNDHLALWLQQKGFNVINQYNARVVDNFDTATLVCRQNRVDILITNITLTGTKDGIELCAWIKHYFSSLVIIWSSESNFENLERARQCGVDHFILPNADINTNLNQIWNAIFLSLPGMILANEKSISGSFLDVKEIDTNKIISGHEQRSQGSVYQEKFIRWIDVTHIISYNVAKAGEGNNNLLICTTANHKGFIYRGSLSDISSRLPEFFARFDKGTIINLHHITAKGRGYDLFYIDNLQFRLSSIYKNEVMDRLNMFLYKKI